MHADWENQEKNLNMTSLLEKRMRRGGGRPASAAAIGGGVVATKQLVEREGYAKFTRGILLPSLP